MRIIDMLTRFQIEEILAYDYVGRDADRAGDLLHIGGSCLREDLKRVDRKTGLNPFDASGLYQLLNAIETERKEQMHGRVFSRAEYLEGKRAVAERAKKRAGCPQDGT